MKDKTATGRHAAPQQPTGREKLPRVKNTTGKHPAVKEKRQAAPKMSVDEMKRELLESRPSRLRKKTVLIALALVVVLLLIMALSLQGATAEKRYREHLRQAEESYHAGEYDNALGHLRQAAATHDSREIRLQMVDCYEALGNYDKALELLRAMDLGDEEIRVRIDLLEGEKELVRQAGKITIAGMEMERNASSLIIRRTTLGEQDLRSVAMLYALSSLSLTEDGLSDVSALSGLGGLTMLDLSGNDIAELGPLATLTGLRTLYLDGNPITDFSPLYTLQELKMLSIRNIEISEAQLQALSEALPNCAIHSETAVAEARELSLGGVTFSEEVTELDLSGCQLNDIGALSACRQLTVLDLSDNEIADLTPLMDLPYLAELNISGNRVGDLRPLMAMKSLQKLNASGNEIRTTAALCYLTELRELDLSGNELQDLSGLAPLSLLEKLNLENAWLHNEYLESLGTLYSLKELNLKENPELTGDAVDELKRELPNCFFETSRLVYTVEIHGERWRMDLTVLDLSGFGEPFDLSEIVRIRELEKLDLSGNRLESLYDLQSLEKLRELDLSDNQVADPTPLAYLTELEKLDLSNNRLTSVTALLNLSRLKELDIRGNAELTAEQIERLQRALPGCTVYHD